MLTKTSVTAARLLVRLSLEARPEATSLRQIARHLQVSPSYLMKISRHLVRAGILRANRGSSGGVFLNRAPAGITLLEIVEACQGRILGDFCRDTNDLRQVCALHKAGADLHKAITGALTRWTLKDLSRRPCPATVLRDRKRCLLLWGHL